MDKGETYRGAEVAAQVNIVLGGWESLTGDSQVRKNCDLKVKAN